MGDSDSLQAADTGNEEAHELTARYFDGELEGDHEQRALEHLASCTQCQAELEDLIGLELALRKTAPTPSQAATVPQQVLGATAADVPPQRPAAPVTSLEAVRARKRRTVVGLGLVVTLAAAAAGVALVLQTPAHPALTPTLALASSRSVEVRFGAAPFAAHRPYRVMRAGAAREGFSLAALAELERAGQTSALIAAHASSGELTRAIELAQAQPLTAQREADLAALELLRGEPERALEAAERALELMPALPAAHWNRALAARALGLLLEAASAFQNVIAAGEQGWAEEARIQREHLLANHSALHSRLDSFTQRAMAMIDRSGPPLTDADLTTHPDRVRLYFHDALRSASTTAEALALEPLALALDRAVAEPHTMAALRRVVSSGFSARARFAPLYRELATGRATDEGAKLLAMLEHAPAALDDMRLGAIVLARKTFEHHAELSRLIAATQDPWFLLMAPNLEAGKLIAAGNHERAEQFLHEALAACDERKWAWRCGPLAIKLAELYLKAGRYLEAETNLERVVEFHRSTGSLDVENMWLMTRGEALRALGRYALAAAIFREVLLRFSEQECEEARYAMVGLAQISLIRRASLRDLELQLDACGAAPNWLELAITVDLARMSRRAEDFARAEQWIAAARAAAAPDDLPVADAAHARLWAGRVPEATAKLRALLPAFAAEQDIPRAIHSWLTQTLIETAAAAEKWSEVVQLTAEELGVATPKSCALAVSLDDTRGVAVALDATGVPHAHRREVAAPLRWRQEHPVSEQVQRALHGCASITVLARPPLHGRADLLPPELPWAFASGQRQSPGATPTSSPRRELFVGDVQPPAHLGLPALAPMRAPAGAITLRGRDATPRQVLAELAQATYAELHVHGQVELSVADASFLALSPDLEQRWALSTELVRKAKLPSAPVVVLAACRAATAAPYEHKRQSLPDAFLEAGARAVIAPTVEIPDDTAAAFFAELRTKLAAGEAPAVALAALRKAYLAHGEAWAASVLLFE